MTRVLVLLSLFILLATVQAASSATSFCKCICFNSNSTIIALNPPKSSSSTSALHSLLLRNPSSSDGVGGPLTCTSCNRAFCLSYNLPICANAKEEDVFTTCFQRDSVKDEAVVFIFIITTAGLLGWAVLKPWIAKWTGWGGSGPARGEREARYAPLGGDGQAEGSVGRDSGLHEEREGEGER